MTSTSSLMSSPATHDAYAQTEGNNTNTRSYTDPAGGMTFQYPASWEIRDVDLQRPDAISATRLLPPGQNNTGFIDNVLISVNRVSNTTLGRYTEEALAVYNNFSNLITITKSEPSTLGGNPAHSIEYLENQPGQPLHKLQVWSIAGDRVYIVTYAADESEFSQNLPDVQNIIGSLLISDGAQVQQQQFQPDEQGSPKPFYFN
jgi:eukaryotic-like serine/threonine-protein kinase